MSIYKKKMKNISHYNLSLHVWLCVYVYLSLKSNVRGATLYNIAIAILISVQRTNKWLCSWCLCYVMLCMPIRWATSNVVKFCCTLRFAAFFCHVCTLQTTVVILKRKAFVSIEMSSLKVQMAFNLPACNKLMKMTIKYRLMVTLWGHQWILSQT